MSPEVWGKFSDFALLSLELDRGPVLKNKDAKTAADRAVCVTLMYHWDIPVEREF